MDLDPPREAKQRLLDEAAARVLEWLDAVPAGPIVPPGGPEAVRGLRWDPPAQGRPADEVLTELFNEVVPHGYNVCHPGFLAYVPNTGLWAAAVADLIADALDRYPTVRVAGAGPARIEDEVLRWCSEWLGLPAGAGGILTSGGSMANLSAFVTARTLRGEDDLRRLRWYASDHTHHSNHKAAHMAGLPATSFVMLPSDEGGELDVDALDAAIQADLDAGLVPCMIIANAGTTDAGAVDDLQAIASVARKHQVWLHADAAYGGFFVLTERGRPLLRGIEECDSVTLDPHKGLGLPFGTGALVVKDVNGLHKAHAMRGQYMPATIAEPDAADLGPELSRSWRGLRMWLPIMVHGLDSFTAALDRALDLADDAARRLAKIDGITVHRAPRLSAFAFRPRGPRGAADRLMAKVNARGRVFLSGTRFDGLDWVRVCILNAKTGPAQVEALVDDVIAALAEA